MGIVLKQTKTTIPWKKYIFSRGFAVVLALAFLAINAYGYVFVYQKVVLQKDIPALRQMAKTNVSIVTNWVSGLFASPEKMVIDISHVNMQQLQFKRQQALELGSLVTEEDDYVSADIRYKEEEYRVDLRLKGDWLEHVDQEKWSYRVKVKKNKTIDGMTIFSLQHPKARNYLYEWVHQEALRKEGVIALRYDFVELVVNGENMGVYALEENFDKILVEHNRRREAPIIRFDENDLWLGRSRFEAEQEQSGSENYLSSGLDTFRRSQTFSDPILNSRYTYGANLLDAFRRGERTTSEVFDVPQMAKFMAMSDLFGSNHGTIWHNLRFYINPITNRLEPIVFDNFGGLPTTRLSIAKPVELNQQLFADPAFTQEYIKQLHQFSQKEYIDTLLDELDKDGQLSDHLQTIHSEYPYHYFAREVFYSNQTYIQNILEPINPLLTYTEAINNTQAQFRVANRQILPIHVLGITDGTNTAELSSPQRLVGRLSDAPLNYESFTVETSTLSPSSSDWMIVYQVEGQETRSKQSIYARDNNENFSFEADLLKQEPNIFQFTNVFRIDEQTKTITNRNQETILTETVIVPAGYTVEIQKNSRVILENDAQFISYSPIQAIGTADEPIVFTTGPKSTSGFFVLDTPETSTFWYTEFSEFSLIDRPPLLLTTGVMFYNTDVAFHHVSMKNNRSGDDLVNIFSSTFLIEDSSFEGSLADAIDCDFSNGTIARSDFSRVGNDGIDVSGGIIEVESIFITGAGDKAISIGENSQLIGKNITITSSTIGVASKDSSVVHIQDSSIMRTELGVGVFQKKPEFTPATIRLSNTRLSTTNQQYLVEEDSQLFIDGNRAPANTENLRKYLYEE